MHGQSINNWESERTILGYYQYIFLYIYVYIYIYIKYTCHRALDQQPQDVDRFGMCFRKIEIVKC
jgi:hypothetical protein